jgi:hypothetical protein
MTLRVAFLISILQLALGAWGQVVEGGARATLEKDAICVALPLSGAAGSGTRVVVWLASPTNVRSVETVATLSENGRLASATLAWPKDATGKNEDDIGWFRVGYRVEVNGSQASSGVLSVGAITANLMALRIAYPKMIAQGSPGRVRVLAVNPVTGKALGGVSLRATLTRDEVDSPKKTLTRVGRTGRNGEAILSFAALGEPGDSLDLSVAGTLAGAGGAIVRDTVAGDLEVMDPGSVHIEMDKPLHKPGEVVHLRALAFRSGNRAAADEPVTVTVTDPDNKTLAKGVTKTNRFGIAAYDWKTTEQTATGNYDVKFGLDNVTGYWSDETQTVRIQRYEVPEFSVSATPDRAFYLPGQAAKVKIHAGYLFGKSVAAGTVRLVRAGDSEWNPKTGRYEMPDAVEARAQLDPGGDATLTLRIAEEFEQLKGDSWERFRDVKYRAMVADASTGRSESRNFTVRLTKEPVHIYLSAIGSGERDGEYLISTVYADGTPATCHATLDWMDGQSRPQRAVAVKTNRYGLAKVLLHFPAKTTGEQGDRPKIRVTARDAEGRISHFDDELWAGQADAIWLSLNKSVLKPGEAIEGSVHARAGTDVDVDVLSEATVLGHWQIHMSGQQEPFSLPASPAFHGQITVRAYNLRHERREATSRSVLYPEDHSLSASVKGVAASYAPGAKVNGELVLRSADKGATAGVFGVSVFDTAVEQRAETEEEANDRRFGRGWWWLDSTRVGDVTRESLDKIDTSQPVEDDLDLAAEAILLNQSTDSLAIQSNEENEVRSEYQHQMEAQVKPLGEAILAGAPLNLPTTLEEARKFAVDAKLSPEILVDPWNVPYKVETGEGWHTDLVTLRSAGPDKQFGTADDFTLTLVERNVFAIPGVRLNALLSEAALAGKPFPGTVTDLKGFAKAGGLDLDSAAQHTMDRKGKPYKYTIALAGPLYIVQVQDDHAETIWQSGGVDYFLRTQAKLNEALLRWQKKGHLFPTNESEARQAFAAAGVDFDSLRDPLGLPFVLKIARDYSYASVDDVKAGVSIQGDAAKVTLVAESIRVLRSDEKTASLVIGQEVARFTHTISQQSGSDLSAVAVDGGLFQGNTGAIGGHVTDMTGSVIPGAKVRVASVQGDAATTATTKTDGSYVVPDLAPGFYKVRVDMAGFQSYAITDVHVSSSALTRVDVKLPVPTVSETVEVSAESVSLNTTMASVVKLAPGVFASEKKATIAGRNGSASITEQKMTPRLRHVFQETAYWAPSLETTPGGHTKFNFTLPDSLTTWRLHAVGSTVDGRMTQIDQDFKTFQPFFVDLDAPQVLTVGDQITLPVNLRNYTAHAIALPVTVKSANWFTLFTPISTRATIAPDAATPILVGLRAASSIDAGPLRITAANAHDGDAVEKTIRVHPDGEPRSLTTSVLLHGDTANKIQFDLPAEMIAGSLHSELLLYPNLGANVAHSMKAVLERPYGCGEQTISSTYPSLLYLELAAAAKMESPERAKAQGYLQMGYERLLGYFNPAGGLTYWGGNDTTGDTALTAYGVEFLTEALSFVSVDRTRIARAVEWLVAQQNADGSWPARYGAVSARDTLLISNALQTAIAAKDFSKGAPIGLEDRVRQAISKAEAYAATSVLALHDPYSNALRAFLAAGAGDSVALARARQELVISVERGKAGAYWQVEGYSPFYSWGTGGRLETTSLALAALQAAGNKADETLEGEALLYLLQNRDVYGVWMSGQATVRVLKALLPLAIQQLQSPAVERLTLTVNGQPLSPELAASLKPDSKLLDAPRPIDLSGYFHSGENTLEFGGASNATFANAQLTASLYVPWTQAIAGKTQTTVPGKSFGLDFGYTCDAANATVGQSINCTVSARRFGSGGYGMLLAEVGLPPGADVDRASLAKLLDSWTISRYELQPDRIVFYMWSSLAEGNKFNFSFTPRYAINAKAAPAKLFDYYNPDLSAVIAPQRFAVSSVARDRKSQPNPAELGALYPGKN